MRANGNFNMDKMALACSQLPAGDRTPVGWTLNDSPAVERLKWPFRRIVYPPYLRLINSPLERKFDPSRTLGVDQWFWGHRGFDARTLKLTRKWHRQIEGRSILIVGCGTGSGIDTWLDCHPAKDPRRRPV